MVARDTAITIESVVTGYRSRHRVTRLAELRDLRFAKGGLTAIVGSNGVGKSTLLKSICGLLPALEGEILLDGKNVNAYGAPELSRKISIVLTEKVGGFNLKVRDVVAAGQMPYTNTFHQLKADHRRVIEEAMSRGGVTRIADKLVHELSDGMRQKTMIARALAQQTGVLLLDEPTAFLDYASKHQLFTLLASLATGENRCVLVSTHDLDLVLRYCDSVLVMDSLGAELMQVSQARSSARFMAIGGGFL